MIRPFLSLLLVFAALPAQQPRPEGAVRIGTWNIENLGFRNPLRNDADHAAIGALIAELQVDLLAVQEIGSEAALERVARAIGPDWRFVLGTTGGFRESDQAIRVGFLWNDARLELLAAGELLHLPREVDGVPIFHRIPVTACFRSRDGGIDFRAVTVHIKASRGELNERKRSLEAGLLRDWLQELQENAGEDRDIVVLGDFNHTYDAPAFRVFTQGGAVRYLRPGRLGFTIVHFDDPIDMIAVAPGLEEARERTLTVHNARAAKDKDAWRRVYSDHVPVTVELDAERDRDPDATFGGPEHPLQPFALGTTASHAAIGPGDRVAVVLRQSGSVTGILLAPLGDWVQLRTDDGGIEAFPRDNVARVRKQ